MGIVQACATTCALVGMLHFAVLLILSLYCVRMSLTAVHFVQIQQAIAEDWLLPVLLRGSLGIIVCCKGAFRPFTTNFTCFLLAGCSGPHTGGLACGLPP